ncbi:MULTISPECIES: 16S rRNA (uracil(1498)-N(3))-methyltransferase [Chromobacterium]|uniref:16S rRNA (uracil(1498)-N(3))-methyltransferase n=1 Tax=Chromobacterium TaxID=535 RepID=UPI000DF006E2|nr:MULTISPECIES: 16S rRNA (uracil(1498)-N(3))-methyltransferase [Chromobacterium]QOZ85669.1 16S rRNA (uracil(1498)-N(3))-methyltransferase [Chromobacterium sp. Rain0013]UGA39936.1 16S rRNA (uracil(1498)-N(3))-methyltransferase [Chromobacterium haemolyticum]WON82269.1 16S rRNA (uracil(1498)-N(3))-methyltransferase [Chromobacterium haemolyticum]
MPRFYIDADLCVGQTLALPDTVVRHVQVLRLNAGDAVTLFNGRGGEYAAVLDAVMKRDAHCRIEGFDDVSRETPIWLGLAQAISGGDKMEFTLQKGVEMGVSAFQPIAAERSIVKLSGERADKRVARWQEIVISACEQSGRNAIPEVLPILSLEQWLKQAPSADARLILSPVGSQRLADIAAEPKRAWLMAGPEGGYSAREEAAALDAGWTPLKLGPRILRTETAALAAVAAIQTVWGDYR